MKYLELIGRKALFCGVEIFDLHCDVKFGRARKNCGNTRQRLVLPQRFSFSQTFFKPVFIVVTEILAKVVKDTQQQINPSPQVLPGNCVRWFSDSVRHYWSCRPCFLPGPALRVRRSLFQALDHYWGRSKKKGAGQAGSGKKNRTGRTCIFGDRPGHWPRAWKNWNCFALFLETMFSRNLMHVLTRASSVQPF